MKRRYVLMILGANAVAAAAGARAQSPTTPVVGYLNSSSAAAWPHSRAVAFQKGLAEAGYVEGRNVVIEFRWAEGQYDRLPELAADLLRRNVSVVAAAGINAALAAKQAASTVPVVFSVGSDPVEQGLVASFNRPGGNATGVSILALELEAKLLSLLHELVPNASVAGIIVNPDNRPITEGFARVAQKAGRTFGMEVHVLNARSDEEIDAAFAALRRLRAGALVVGADPLFETRRDRLVTLAARQALPALYFDRVFALAGGLASYGADLDDASRQVGLYVGRILAGARPAEMPIVQLTKIQLVINAKTAKTLGLIIPQSLLLRADEVIQ